MKKKSTEQDIIVNHLKLDRTFPFLPESLRLPLPEIMSFDLPLCWFVCD